MSGISDLFKRTVGKTGLDFLFGESNPVKPREEDTTGLRKPIEQPPTEEELLPPSVQTIEPLDPTGTDGGFIEDTAPLINERGETQGVSQKTEFLLESDFQPLVQAEREVAIINPPVEVEEANTLLQETKFNKFDDEKLTKQIFLHEGFRTKVYKDTKGIPTIGVGFNLMRGDAREKIEAIGANYQKILTGTQSLSRDQIKKLVMDDIKQSVLDAKDLFPSFDSLSGVRQRVLVDMAFNLGKRGLSQFRRLRKAVSEGDWSLAARSMRESLWFRQVKGRAIRLTKMMETDQDQIS